MAFVQYLFDLIYCTEKASSRGDYLLVPIFTLAQTSVVLPIHISIQSHIIFNTTSAWCMKLVLCFLTSDPVRFDPVRSDLIRSGPIRSGPIRSVVVS